LAIVLLLVFLSRLDHHERLTATAIGSVLGGAIGNLTDRLVYGEVIDFLDFRLWGGYVWPTFNLADCWIVVGVAILMLETFLDGGDGEAEDGSADQDEAEDAPAAAGRTCESRRSTLPPRTRRTSRSESPTSSSASVIAGRALVSKPTVVAPS
jgi:hypothetical protein